MDIILRSVSAGVKLLIQLIGVFPKGYKGIMVPTMLKLNFSSVSDRNNEYI